MIRKIIEIGTVKNETARYDTLYRGEGTKSTDVYSRERLYNIREKLYNIREK